MIRVTLPHVAIVHFPNMPYEAHITIQEVSSEEAAAEEEHVIFRLFYVSRERSSFLDGLDEETVDAEEDRWLIDHSQTVHYRLTWRDKDEALFNLHDCVLPSPTAVFPRWYETFCARLADYVNGYLFDHPWRLDAYETKAPAKLGGILENVPVLETAAEKGARTRFGELQRQRGETAIQTDLFMDRVTPVLYVTP